MVGEGVHTQGEPVWVRTRDGRALYAMVLPGPAGATGVPTVVFEAGSAATRSTWALVHTRVAAFTRAVVYDRAGLGRSAPDGAGRTLDRMADDLNDLLDGLEPSSGFVLVGHSAGGPIVRLAASRRPDRVAGLVLVDPTDEAASLLFGVPFRVGEKIVIAVEWVLARVGMLERFFRFLGEGMPEDVRADLHREAFRPAAVSPRAGKRAPTSPSCTPGRATRRCCPMSRSPSSPAASRTGCRDGSGTPRPPPGGTGPHSPGRAGTCSLPAPDITFPPQNRT
ncbi:alpha/beta hydrolase [Microbacterium sp. NPDC077057]|uniref:alpha/beta fold hydrolase n=1 Tax=Microbacterium sp. NPDC077057 TaxID=3154763 RepID=UPI003430DCEA